MIVARGRDGGGHLPVQRNLSPRRHPGATEVPNKIAASALPVRRKQPRSPMAQWLRGVLCVEYFVLQDGTLVVNEMAPRPHNSGHYSIDACDVSQFDLQARAGRPALVAPRQHSAAIMLNLLGDLWFAARRAAHPAPGTMWPLPGAHLHLYGKTETRGPQDGSPDADWRPRRRRARRGAAGPPPHWHRGLLMVLDGTQARAIDLAVERLAAGQLLGLPTETVYGLAADAGNDAAVRAIFAAKGRPADHPLIVHVRLPPPWRTLPPPCPDFAQRLIDAFWPGPLTLILPRREAAWPRRRRRPRHHRPALPAHPVARALLAARTGGADRWLAAPSANCSAGQPHHRSACGGGSLATICWCWTAAPAPWHRVDHHRLHAGAPCCCVRGSWAR